MRTKEQIERALDVIEKAGKASIVMNDEVSMAVMVFAWGVLAWVLKDQHGDSFQATLEACNRFDETMAKYDRN